MSETKQYQFDDIIEYLRDTSNNILITSHMTIAGLGPVVQLKEAGAHEVAENLLKIGEWLGRLEEHLNHVVAGHSEIPVLAVTSLPSPVAD